jgi:hypothetical protein
MTFYFFLMLSTLPFNQYWLRTLQKSGQHLHSGSIPPPVLPYEQDSRRIAMNIAPKTAISNSVLPQVNRLHFPRTEPQNRFKTHNL